MRGTLKFRRRRSACAGAAALTMIGLGGCSTIKSVDLSQTPIPARKDAYLTYSVAKSLFTIQIAAASPPSSSSGAAATGSSAAAKTGTATTPATTTSWTLSGSLTASGANASPNGGQGTANVDSSPCGELQAEYAAAQALVNALAAEKVTLIGKLQKMAGGDMKTNTPADLKKDLAQYVTDLGDPSYLGLVEVSQKTLYPKIVALCAPRVTVTIQQAIVPDASRSFAVLPQSNPFYTDALTLGVDANGFLTNGAPTSTSEVAQTVSAIANDVGMMVPASAPLPAVARAAGGAAASLARAGKGKPGQSKPAKPKGPSCTLAGPPSFVADIGHLGACDPKKDVDTAEMLAKHLLVGLFDPKGPQPARLSNLPSSLLPLTFYTTLADWKEGGEPGPGPIPALSKQLQLKLKLTCAKRNGSRPQAEPIAADSPENNASKFKGVYDGLVVSAARQCRFEASQLANFAPADLSAAASVDNRPKGVDHLISDTYFLAQDSRYLTLLPTERGFLVQRSVAYTFAGGQPTGVTDSRPSEALAVVSFPGQVLGAFFSGITSAFTDSQANINGKTADLTAQTNYLTAQANLAAAKKAAAAAAAATPTTSP